MRGRCSGRLSARTCTEIGNGRYAAGSILVARDGIVGYRDDIEEVALSLLGGYVRGSGHHLTPFGLSAPPRTFDAVGGGSTMWMVDPERDLTLVYCSAGFLEGLDRFTRLQQVADLALTAVSY